MISDEEKSEETALESDNASVVISRESYEQFLAVLDEPPKPIFALRQLFSKENVAEENE